LRYGRLIAGLSALAFVVGASSIALEYLVPSPPLRITIATGRKGTTFDYFGERYRGRFASAGIELNVRETNGALENLKLLRDSNSNVQVAFSTGGISNSTQAPNLRSMGLIFNVPFWIFYPSSQSLESLTQLKGKRIAVGPEGSGSRYRLWHKADVQLFCWPIPLRRGSTSEPDVRFWHKADIAAVLSNVRFWR
jgi:TRAP-type uncharacterized transport system substrate-binding protein